MSLIPPKTFLKFLGGLGGMEVVIVCRFVCMDQDLVSLDLTPFGATTKFLFQILK